MVVDWFLSVGIERGNPFFCMECGVTLYPGDNVQWDHRHAIVHDGPHEYQNLMPLHTDPCHKAKTKRDVAANAKVKRIRGETKTKPSKPIPSRPFPKRK